MENKYTVTTSGYTWLDYTDELPKGSTILGIVESDKRTGVLIRLDDQLAQVAKGRSYKLNQQMAAAALAEAQSGIGRLGRTSGSGRKAVDGVVGTLRVNLSIDKVSHQILTEYGDGNFSLGCRRAALLVEMSKK